MQLSYGNKKILQIAIPSIVSNITVPLLGLIDVTIVGHLGSAAYIGAIAVGGMLFNIIYWIFGFLRMGTSGMTSQAYGRHDLNEVTRLLLRSVGVGLFIALILLALQYPIEKVAFTLIDTTDEVAQLSALYFRICIWGAPAVLGLYSFAGWYAEFAFPHVHCHHSKHREYRGKPLPGLWLQHENRRSSHRHINRTVCRISDGIPALDSLLWQFKKAHRMAFLFRPTSHVPFL